MAPPVLLPGAQEKRSCMLAGPGDRRAGPWAEGNVPFAVDYLTAMLSSERAGRDRLRGIVSVEVGGSGVEYVTGLFGQPGRLAVSAARPSSLGGLHTCFTAPGLVAGGTVRGAHHLGWMDVDGWAELGLAGVPEHSMNDAEACALGEWCPLRGSRDGDLIYVGLGTSIGSARVSGGGLAPIELSHRPGFGPRTCGGCGRLGCLDAQISGHALPVPLTDDAIGLVASLLSEALGQCGAGPDTAVVMGGGMIRSRPGLVTLIRGKTGWTVEPTLAPELKSAASVALFSRVLAEPATREEAHRQSRAVSASNVCHLPAVRRAR